MTALLNITSTEGHVTTLHFEGRLDRQTERLAIDSARSALDAGARLLLIDLSGVDVVTSMGLHALHDIFKMFTPHEDMQAWLIEHADETYKSPYFKLAGASSHVSYVLSISGLLQNIFMYPSVKEALDSFSS